MKTPCPNGACNDGMIYTSEMSMIKCGTCDGQGEIVSGPILEQTPAEQAFDKFLHQGTNDDDPYWQLFECKDIVNTFIMKAVEYGYKKGYEQADKVPSAFTIMKMKKLEPLISKIGGWSNFIAYLEKHFEENIK